MKWKENAAAANRSRCGAPKKKNIETLDTSNKNHQEESYDHAKSPTRCSITSRD